MEALAASDLHAHRRDADGGVRIIAVDVAAMLVIALAAALACGVVVLGALVALLILLLALEPRP